MTDSFQDRIDFGILAAASRLARLRDQTVRGGVADFLASSVENARDSVGTADEDIWRFRVDRCRALLLEEDSTLRSTARVAVEKGF